MKIFSFLLSLVGYACATYGVVQWTGRPEVVYPLAVGLWLMAVSVIIIFSLISDEVRKLRTG